MKTREFIQSKSYDELAMFIGMNPFLARSEGLTYDDMLMLLDRGYLNTF